jgi:parallel beta-helix repeat protein
MRRRSWPLVLLLAALAPVPDVEAAPCGDEVPCGCGDALEGHYRLPGDLGPCGDNGIVLRGGAVLDCAGHVIRGTPVARSDGPPPLTVGILLDGTIGAVVRHCGVTEFRTGIELREATRSTVLGCTAFKNGDTRARIGYGIHLARARENTIMECTVRESADEGIHVGSGADDNTLIGNELVDNGRENLYVLEARGTRIVRNRAGGRVVANLYMKHAAGGRVEANRFDGRPVVIRGRSVDNTLVDNVFGGGLSFRVYPERVPAGGDQPARNVVRGGELTGTTHCLNFSDASDNEIAGVTLTGCGRIVAHSERAGANKLVDLALEQIPLDLSGGATLRLLGTVHVSVADDDGRAVKGAAVTVRIRNGDVVTAAATDGEGRTAVVVPSHVVGAGSLVAMLPAVLHVDAEGHRSREAEIADPLPDRVTVRLDRAR